MSTTVFLAVLLAALLHATRNAMVKSGADKHATMAAVVLGHAPIALLTLPFVPVPDPASLPWIAVGVALHVGYQLFLIAGYRIGDLTQVYPTARSDRARHGPARGVDRVRAGDRHGRAERASGPREGRLDARHDLGRGAAALCPLAIRPEGRRVSTTVSAGRDGEPFAPTRES